MEKTEKRYTVKTRVPIDLSTIYCLVVKGFAYCQACGEKLSRSTDTFKFNVNEIERIFTNKTENKRDGHKILEKI